MLRRDFIMPEIKFRVVAVLRDLKNKNMQHFLDLQDAELYYHSQCDNPQVVYVTLWDCLAKETMKSWTMGERIAA
jgi:predicted RNA-binding protein with PUA-like domain